MFALRRRSKTHFHTRLWGFYDGNDFSNVLSQLSLSLSLSNPPLSFLFFFNYPPRFLFVSPACSGRQHVGSGDRPVPHAGRVRHVLLARGELGPEGGPGALQRLYAAARLQGPERRVLTRLAQICLFFIMKNSWTCPFSRPLPPLSSTVTWSNLQMTTPPTFKRLIVCFSCELIKPRPSPHILILTALLCR